MPKEVTGRRAALTHRPNLDTTGMTSMNERARGMIPTPPAQPAAQEAPSDSSNRFKMGSADLVRVPNKGDKTTLTPTQLTQLTMLRAVAYTLPAWLVLEADGMIRNTRKRFSETPDDSYRKILGRVGIAF